MKSHITGIQQIGIGVKDARESMLAYKDLFGMDTLIFDDISDACLMTRYTGGNVYSRRAILSMNLMGGGGVEIWQFKSRTPAGPEQPIAYGDLGIYAAKVKCKDVAAAHRQLQGTGLWVSGLQEDCSGQEHFWTRDAYGNLFNIIKGNHWFRHAAKNIGGITGAVIGVKDIDKSIVLYRDVLGIAEVVYDKTGDFNDNPDAIVTPSRRVLLRRHPDGKGAFGKLLGSIEVELVQCLEKAPATIYKDRFWGDCGFIHLCFDVLDMDALKAVAEKNGYNFTVDSQESFPMEDAAGRFCYVEDNDGTLIELVETHKVPVMKKLGLYLNLKKRNIEKPLPDWMIKLLALNKVK